MSGDPLDAVGQGHAWYGYNLPRPDENSRQPMAQSSASAQGPQRRPGGLMADHLFGGVGSQQEAALNVKQESVYATNTIGGQQQQQHRQQHQQQQQWQQQQLQLQKLQLQQQQQQQQQHQQRQHQQLNALMQLADTPPFPPASAAPFDLSWSLPPSEASSLMFPSLDLQSQVLMMQQATAPPPPPIETDSRSNSTGCGHSDTVAAATAAAGHYFTFDRPNLHPLTRPPPQAAAPVGAGAGAAAGASAAARGTLLSSQHSAAVMGTTGGASSAGSGGGRGSVGFVGAGGAGGGGGGGGGVGYVGAGAGAGEAGGGVGGDDGGGGGGAAGGYGAIGNASGLGLWGWCFPSPVAGASMGPAGELGTGGAGVGGVGVVDNLQPESGVPMSAQGVLGQHSGAMPLGRSLDEGWSGGDILGLGGAGASGMGASGGAEVPGLGALGGDQEESGEGTDGGGGGGKAREKQEWGTLNASELRRKERNAREQRRSLMTSQQIDKLRQLLLDCGIQTKTNKSSVLSEVASYMTQLEEQLADLEAERQRWMAETADAPEVARQDPNGGAIDCKQVFAHASVALAMATVEGRLIESNLQFEALSGYLNDEIKQLTLLSLTAPSDLQETFGRLSAMLTDGTGKAPKHVLAKAVLKNQDQDMSLSLTLVRDALGRPKYFLCSLLPNTSRASSSSSSSPTPAPAPAPAAAAAAVAAAASAAAGGAAGGEAGGAAGGIGHSSSCSSSSSRSSSTCTPQSSNPAGPSSVSTTTSDEAFAAHSSSSAAAIPGSAPARSTAEAAAASTGGSSRGGAGTTGAAAASKGRKAVKLESSSQAGTSESGCEAERISGRNPEKSGGSAR